MKGKRMAWMSERRFDEKARELAFSDEIRIALFPYWVQGKTAEETSAVARAAGIKVGRTADAVRELSKAMQNLSYDQNEAARGGQPEVSDLPDSHAAFMKRLIDNRAPGAGAVLAPEAGDRDRLGGRLFTVAYVAAAIDEQRSRRDEGELGMPHRGPVVAPERFQS